MPRDYREAGNHDDYVDKQLGLLYLDATETILYEQNTAEWVHFKRPVQLEHQQPIRRNIRLINSAVYSIYSS